VQVVPYTPEVRFIVQVLYHQAYNWLYDFVASLCISHICGRADQFMSERCCYTPFTRYNRLSNRLYNRFDNRLYRVNKHPTGCQNGCQPVWQPCWTNSHCSFNRLSNRVVQPVWQLAVYKIQLVVKPAVKRMFVYTIQPVVKTVWQPVVSCKRGFRIAPLNCCWWHSP